MSISQLSGQERLRATQAIAALRSNAVGATGTTPGVTRQPDAVSISDAARSLAAAQKAVSSATDVREDRIAALRSAIADGSYKVDSRGLATSILGTSTPASA
jgi:negative regulator of flagellin synthesis FlgM